MKEEMALGNGPEPVREPDGENRNDKAGPGANGSDGETTPKPAGETLGVAEAAAGGPVVEGGGGVGGGETELPYRRNGNVAKLPRAVRERINQMIQDGVTYAQIIERLGEDGKGLGISNLSRWKDGGYQDWLLEQAFFERTRARQETPAELVRDFDATEVIHAALQLGTLHMFDALRELEPGSLDKRLGGNSAAFARLINALARAGRETMLLQKYREACARARAALQGLKDPNRELTDSERRAIVSKVDQILGLAGPEECTVQSAECRMQSEEWGGHNPRRRRHDWR